MTEASSMAALWVAVIGVGFYHGANPGMGWPLAVSAALMDKDTKSLRAALLALAAGHFLAMCFVLLPFSLIASLEQWQSQIRIGAGALVVLMGLYLLVNRRHPRILARVKPTQLALWSFLAAMAHGAGLMLVPVFLSMSSASGSLSGNVISATMVAAAHTLAMAFACGLVAYVIYRWLGLKFLTRTWFNLDVVWALSLVLVGAIGVYSALSPASMHHAH